MQVDEPALREGLPLKQDRWESYLEWAVDSFRLSTAVAQPHTQIVTHLCYSDFQDILKVYRLHISVKLSLFTPHISVMLSLSLGFECLCPVVYCLVVQSAASATFNAACQHLMQMTMASLLS